MNLNPTKVSAVLCLLTIAACRKSDDNNTSAGKGGNTAVIAKMAHHNISKNIINGTVYIKYNSLDAPANDTYDDSIACQIINEVPIAAFPSLKKGDYYFFARGYDTSFAASVVGGTPYTISDNSTQVDTLAVAVDEKR
ncbi:hypothetical protein [Taibaiella soli]|uniref:Uncharacterized protein n=1 Tax=Taibaiella soli TaxID=1649169 RepID=A0A2W2AZU0_9BACT|nr:hypothetical protein [Taibaiella soli]PZF73218.1 hypothetical protein DN068_10130 [Taibaiella soli]